MVNAVRHKDSSNITICLGNFQDVEKDLENDFDYATLIGVFEYGKGYIGGEKPYHGFLTTVMEHVRPGGKLLLAIENKFGLKYWAGCREDHAGMYFEGLEGYQHTENVRTFSRPELIRIMEECGYTDYKFYYPYPDYKFPAAVYSDNYLPQPGELNRNICNFDRDRLVLMDEGKVFDQILQDHLFPLYANSFFVEITKPGIDESQPEQLLYTKYSSGRSKQFSIQTRIVRDRDGKNIVYKKAEYAEGQKHLGHIAEAAKQLDDVWKEYGQFSVNRCVSRDGRVEFEYLQGITVEEELDVLLSQGNTQEAAKVLREAAGRICGSARTEQFKVTPEFKQVFGEAQIPAGEPSFTVADIDLIFSNLRKTADGKWNVLDYEWTFFFAVPVKYILFRALHYYLESAPIRAEFGKLFDFYEEFGITREQREIYRQMELRFQKYVAGSGISPGSLYCTMGKPALPLGQLLAETERRKVQVYLDYGQGFCEENSYFVEQKNGKEMHYIVTIPEQAVGVTIDPAFSACFLKDVSLTWIGEEGQNLAPVLYETTGYQAGADGYVFDNCDPKIIIKSMMETSRRIEVSYRINLLEEETVELLLGKMDTKGRDRKKVRRLIKG